MHHEFVSKHQTVNVEFHLEVFNTLLLGHIQYKDVVAVMCSFLGNSPASEFY